MLAQMGEHAETTYIEIGSRFFLFLFSVADIFVGESSHFPAQVGKSSKEELGIQKGRSKRNIVQCERICINEENCLLASSTQETFRLGRKTLTSW